MLPEVLGLKLRALILADFPQVIRDVRFGIQLRAPDPTVDVCNETQVVSRACARPCILLLYSGPYSGTWGPKPRYSTWTLRVISLGPHRPVSARRLLQGPLSYKPRKRNPVP